jgi:hypothetical protein
MLRIRFLDAPQLLVRLTNKIKEYRGAGAAVSASRGGQAKGASMLSSITVKRRKYWLLAASALASSSLGVSEPALAQTCTPPQPNPDPGTGIATCTGTFNSSITYGPPPPPANQLHVILDPGVKVTLPGPGIGVALNNFGNSVPVLLSANGATINVMIHPH